METSKELFLPMLIMAAHSVLVLFTMLLLRIRALSQGRVRLSYFRIFQGELNDQILHQFNHHIRNLFEFPVLFYVVCLSAMSLQKVDTTLIYIAWAFVGARLVHAAVHLTVNVVLLRLVPFAVSICALTAMWIHLALSL